MLAAILLAPLMAGCAKAVGTNYDDATITTRVKTAFVNDPVVGKQPIDVETFKGVVTLSGRVKTKEEEQKAVDLARAIRGVVEVKSKLTIGS